MRSLTPDDFLNSGQRGMGFGYMYQGDRSAEDLDALAATGAATARVTLQIVRKGSSFAIPADELACLDRTIAELAKRSVRTIICISVGVQGECRARYIWTNKSLRASFVARHRALAKRYKGRGEIAGIDLFNEPVPPGALADYSDRQAAWQALAALTVAGIRKIDPTRIAIVQSAPDATPHSLATLVPMADPLVVYSLHSYTPMRYTHQRVMGDFVESPPYGADVAAEFDASMTAVAAWVQQHRRPVWVGEFSALQTADGAAKYVALSIATFERLGLSWSYHEFRGWRGWDAEVAGEKYERTDDAPMISVIRAALARRQGVKA